MLPDQYVFNHRARRDRAVAVAIAAAAGRDANVYIRDVGGGGCVIARQRTIAVEKSEIGRLDAVLLLNKVAYSRTGDELLTFQDAAKQQPDDHQDDRDLDQGKTRFSLPHFCPLP